MLFATPFSKAFISIEISTKAKLSTLISVHEMVSSMREDLALSERAFL